jgi:CBS-domain-containing membrane protein
VHEPISPLLKHKGWLVYVNKNDTVSKVLNVLHQHNLTSVPVYDEQAKSFISLVSAMDLVAFVAFDTYFKRVKKEQIKFEVHFPDLSKAIIDVITVPGKEYHGPAMTVTIDEQANVRQALEVFSQGVHHALVGSGTPDKTKILSQSDLVTFMLERYDTLPTSVKEPLDKLGLVSHEGRISNKLVAMSAKNSAVEGFRKIYRQGVTAIAIVDDNDELIGTLSASDIRGIKMENLSSVLEPVMEFLAKKFPQSRPLVTVTAHANLKEVMEKLIMGKVHRVWVVDMNSRRPIGVVTMTNVLKVIFDHLRQELLHS